MSIEEKIKTAKEDSWLKDSVSEKEFKEIKDNERRMKEYNCTRVKVRDKKGREYYLLYDKARQLLFFQSMTVEFAKEYYGIEFIEESEEEE